MALKHHRGGFADQAHTDSVLAWRGPGEQGMDAQQCAAMSLAYELFPSRRLLRMQPWFAALKAAHQERLFQATQVVSVDAGQAVQAADGSDPGWCAVLHGTVKLQVPGAGPRTPAAALLVLGSGEWFGELGAGPGAPFFYEAVALHPSSLLCIAWNVVRELAWDSPPFALALLQHSHGRLQQAWAMLAMQRMGGPQQRLGLYLSRHFWRGCLCRRLSQGDLAGLAGVSRQTANGALQALAQQGLVQLDKGQVVEVDHDGLDRFLQLPNGKEAVFPGGKPVPADAVQCARRHLGAA